MISLYFLVGAACAVLFYHLGMVEAAEEAAIRQELDESYRKHVLLSFCICCVLLWPILCAAMLLQIFRTGRLW